jgi:guanylate kinase
MTFDTPTLVTMTAPTCSGKSYLLDVLSEQNYFTRIVSTTTRDPRPGEKEGVDYFFITSELSRKMEAQGDFFELIEFNGVRYGVTHFEMNKKMSWATAPIVILEPQGLQIYREKCQAQGWNTFQIYVHTDEPTRIERLNARTIKELSFLTGSSLLASRHSEAFDTVLREKMMENLPRVISAHTKRLLSVVNDERSWSNLFNWDAIVPGDDVDKAISMIEQGVKWRNQRNAEPQAIGAVQLP